MEKRKVRNFPFDKHPANLYDDDNIPPVDLPRDAYPEEITPNSIPAELSPDTIPDKMPEDVIPDEVPRKDGPGGETGI